MAAKYSDPALNTSLWAGILRFPINFHSIFLKLFYFIFQIIRLQEFEFYLLLGQHLLAALLKSKTPFFPNSFLHVDKK